LCVSGLHRRLGLAGASLAIGLVVSGYMATVQMVRRGFDLSGDLTALPGGAMAQTVFQFGNLLVFSILVGLGLFLRRSRETHKRLLALAVLQTLLAAPVAHLVGHFALPVVLLPVWGLLVLAAFVVHDRRVGGRVHPVTIWGGGGLIVLANLQALLIGPSHAWGRLVAWLSASLKPQVGFSGKLTTIHQTFTTPQSPVTNLDEEVTMRIYSFVLCTFLCTAGTAMAQPAVFGVKAGINLATVTFDPEPDEDVLDRRTGFVGGLFVVVPASDRLGFQGEVLFSQKGASEDGGAGDLALDYLEVPLLLRVGTASPLETSFHAFAGPSIGLRLRARVTTETFDGETEDEDIADDVKGFDFGVVAGAGVNFGRFTLDVHVGPQ
jgi:hypothetical protein